MPLFPSQSNQYPFILVTQLLHFSGHVPFRANVSFLLVVLIIPLVTYLSVLAFSPPVEVHVESNLYWSLFEYGEHPQALAVSLSYIALKEENKVDTLQYLHPV